MITVTCSGEQRINGTSDKAGKITLVCLVGVKMLHLTLYTTSIWSDCFT
jgi:hypothetical protein